MFELRVNASDSNLEGADESHWILTNKTLHEGTGDSLKSVRTSAKALNVLNEELLLDWGISITLHQYQYPNSGNFSEPLTSSIEFDNPSSPWLLGIPDSEGFDLLNWIRAGTQEGDSTTAIRLRRFCCGPARRIRLLARICSMRCERRRQHRTGIVAALRRCNQFSAGTANLPWRRGTARKHLQDTRTAFVSCMPLIPRTTRASGVLLLRRGLPHRQSTRRHQRGRATPRPPLSSG